MSDFTHPAEGAFTEHGARFFNISWRKVGGLRFLKLGRLTLMFCVSNSYRPL